MKKFNWGKFILFTVIGGVITFVMASIINTFKKRWK